MKIRTITVGIPDAFSHEQLQFAVHFNRRCKDLFETHGYDVQTTRISSQAWNQISSLDQILELDCRVLELGGEFFSLGAIFPGLPQTPTYLALIPEAIAHSLTLFASATLTTPAQQIAWRTAEHTAAAIHQIAHKTDDGFCNLRFAAITNCPPNIPPISPSFLLPTGKIKDLISESVGRQQILFMKHL